MMRCWIASRLVAVATLGQVASADPPAAV